MLQSPTQMWGIGCEIRNRFRNRLPDSGPAPQCYKTARVCLLIKLFLADRFMSLKAANTKYLQYLVEYPLLTKSVTAGVLAGLNETISTGLSGEYRETTIAGRKVKHVFSPKILTMIVYGALIVTPISHNMYAVLNQVFKGPNLSKKMKILQILTSLSTITPTLAAIFTAWVSIINVYRPPKDLAIDPVTELKKIATIVKGGLKNGYKRVLKTSLVTSGILLVIAQSFIPPQLWVVFFNLVYFFMGTYQNTKLKLQTRNLKEKKDE